MFYAALSVYLHNGVNLPDKEQARDKPNSACDVCACEKGAGGYLSCVCVCVGGGGLLTSHDEEEEHHDEGITKVEQVAECAGDGGFVGEVMEGEEEEVESSRACGEE